MASLTEK
ncbi:hypothetical protein OYC64_005289 [Pagothenia borchgrevinki]